MLAARIAGTANSAYPDGVPKPVARRRRKQGQAASRSRRKSKERRQTKAEVRGRQGRPRRQEKAEPSRRTLPPSRTRPRAASTSSSSPIPICWPTSSGSTCASSSASKWRSPTPATPPSCVNALDNLSGSDALIALRGRGAERPALQARQRPAPQLRAPLPREGAGADGQAQGGAGPARQAREHWRGRQPDPERERPAGDREVPRRHAGRSGASCARSSARCARTSTASTAGSSSPTSPLVPLLIGFGGLGWAAMQRRRTRRRPPPARRSKGETP